LSRAYAKALQEIGARKKIQAELEQAKAAAEAGSEAKSTFLADHEPRDSHAMNGILGMTELVWTPISLRNSATALASQLSAESLLSIINDILDFSKIEGRQAGYGNDSPSSCARVWGYHEGTELPRTTERTGLIYEVQPDVPEALGGDPGRLRQIIVNLVGNSIKFTERGEIFLSVEKESETPDSVRLHFAIKGYRGWIRPTTEQNLRSVFPRRRIHGGDGVIAEVVGRTIKGL